MRTRTIGIPGLGLAILFAAAVFGQEQTKPEGRQVSIQASTITVERKDGAVMIGTTGEAARGQAATHTFVASEMGFESKVVKGAPFSADTVTEFTQILANGPRIYRKTVSAIFRDSEGRTRREYTASFIGPFAPSGPEKKTIYINDPVAQMSYILDPENRTATTIKLNVNVSAPFGGGVVTAAGTGAGGSAGGGFVGSGSGSGGAGGFGGVAGGVVATPFGTVITSHKHMANVGTETLPPQLIEGVQAEGMRTIETIPTGAIGNDGPIEIVSERWYSPELEMVVRSTRSDPMAGENVYWLTNIRRGEPSPDLFRVPAGYAIKEMKFVSPTMTPAKKDGQ